MTTTPPRRKPQVLAADDPDLVIQPDALEFAGASPTGGGDRPDKSEPPGDRQKGGQPQMTAKIGIARGFRWGGLMFAALGALASIALTLSFTRFVSVALERQDWIGWLSFGLLSLAAVSFLVILVRELIGIWRLRRLGRLRRDLEAALAKSDARGERRAIEAIFANLDGRRELQWSLKTLSEHASGVNDAGDLARLADRDVMPTLDGDARRLVAASARRVSVVTALSPTALLTVGWVLAENLRLLRGLATLYGGQPGFMGSMRLARMVFTHLVATGGVALTDDLFGQFLGQDLVRRLSRRLGESVFNAALTARIGATAIEVIRPLPYLAAPRVRARDFIAEIMRTQRGGGAGKDDPSKNDTGQS